MAENPLSVLIVDDEQIDREAYRLMLSRCMPALRVAGEAENGLEAARFCCEHKPDIVLMDIEMPVLGGMEAIRLLRAERLEIGFVIISAYDYFEHAKEALDLGVLGFLVKPVSEAELGREMERVVAILTEKQKRLMSQLDALESAGQLPSRAALLESLFYAIRANAPAAVRVLADLCGRDISAGFVVVAQARGGEADAFVAWLRRRGGRDISLLWREGSLMVFLLDARGGSPAGEIQRLRAEAQLRFRLDARFFVGGEYAALRDISRSFMQAVSLMDSAREVRLYDPLNDAHRKYPYPFDRELKLLEGIQRRDRERCAEVLAGMLQEVDAACARGDFERLKFVMYELLMALNRQELRGDRAEDTAQLLERAAYNEIGDAQALTTYFLACVDALIGPEAGAGSEKIRPILDYIRNNYNRDIPLSRVARRFYFSQGYLGRLLKDTMGLSYTEIVTRLRVERAIELLLNTQNTIGEISAEVGFKDANYFTKVFKKATGRTPQNYRAERL